VSTIGVPVETPQGVSLAGTTSAESVYIVDSLDGGESITISDRPPMIDPTSMSPTLVIDASTGFHEVAQPGHSSGRAGGELAGIVGIDADGTTVRSLRGGLRLELGPAYQLGVGGSLRWRGRDPALFGFFATLTRWRLWHRLGLRVGLGVGAHTHEVQPRLLWRAEAVVPFGGGERWQPHLTLGIEGVRGEAHPPAGVLGLGLAF
jgi:hypothetical protein